MNKQQEALRLALEALEGFEPNTFIGSDAELLCHAAITAILEALAEPEEKYRYGTPLLDAMTGNAEQTAQQDTIVLTDIEILNCFQQRSKDKTKERRLIAEQIIKTVLEKLQ